MSDIVNTRPLAQDDKLRNTVLAVHALNAASLITGFTSFIAVVVAYMSRERAAGTIYESHLRYAIRTFWWSLALGLVAVVLMAVLVGFLVLPLVGIWYIVRCVRALLAWNDEAPIANPKRFF